MIQPVSVPERFFMPGILATSDVVTIMQKSEGLRTMKPPKKTVIRAMCAAAILLFGPAVQAKVTVSDVALFYRVLDAAHGKPSAADVQKDYLDAGSPGLRDFIPERIGSADKLASLVARRPDIFSSARACMPALATLERQTPELISRLKALYPKANEPDVTIVVGAANSGGTVTPEAGVILALEVTCQNRTLSKLPLDQRFVAILAHEIVHTQQRNNWPDTVLSASLTEGIADFLGEVMSGHTANEQLATWTKGKEPEIAARFRADMGKSDLSAWLYNGLGSAESPGDLGYWVGYRIAKSFYDRMPDKRIAVARLLEESDPQVLLRDSGW